MTNKKSKRRRSSPPSSKKPESFSGPNRLLQVLLAAVVGATAIIFVFVWMTPIDDELEKSSSNLAIDAAALPTESALPGPVVSSSSAQIHPVPPSEATTVLPTEPAAIDVAVLQDELLGLANSITQSYPDDAGAFHFAAQVHYGLQQSQVAEEAWRKCLALSPTVPGPYAGLAELLNKSGRESQSIELLKSAQARGIDSYEMALQLAAAYENTGELELASKSLEAAVESYPSEDGLWLALARVQNQLSEFDKAELTIARAIELAGESEPALFIQMSALARQGKRELASQTQAKLAELNAARTANIVQFQDTYESVLRELAGNAMLSMSAVYEEHHDLDKAEKWLLRALELSPDNGQAYMSLASVYRKQANLASALSVHRKLIQLQPRNMLNYTNLASLQLQAGDIVQAETTLNQAISLDSSDVLSLSALARLKLATGNLAEARMFAARVLQLNYSVESLMLVAVIAETSGEIETARSAIAEARKLNPAHPLLNQREESTKQ
ncbi:MAG: tetratricopeptide repeat protein [Planctomycetales bacterium]|nr:tetratricopeptide repeat protein [Planctomycetales bacterium]